MITYTVIASLGFLVGWVVCAILTITHRGNHIMRRDYIELNHADESLSLEPRVSQERSLARL